LPTQNIEFHPFRYLWLLFRIEPEIGRTRGSDEMYYDIYNETRSPAETIKLWIGELTLYDLNGNTVLTLNDIQDEHFEWTNPYGPSFQRIFPHFMVTPEMVQTGKIKYGN
jgi:hypothetical protein